MGAIHQFRTEVQIPEYSWRLDHSHQIMMIGSCFSENIGQILIQNKFPVDLNPFGILFNPTSIAQSLELLIEKKVFTEEDLFYHAGIWNSFAHHSRFSSVDKDIALDTINRQVQTSSENLRNASSLIITFGTAWVYEYQKTGQIVSNCHKLPANEFKRYRLSIPEIMDQWINVLHRLWEINPELRILFTVSPIRHWKDGPNENQLSKSTLLLAVDHLVKEFGPEKAAYF
ncbi:MAG: GSCFA domain-containing protein, partial [Bacteroidota bacterium]|nr:GSCFA domain-containing protein [Bacteroidota bacterium]